jgi:hypothetical protein
MRISWDITCTIKREKDRKGDSTREIRGTEQEREKRHIGMNRCGDLALCSKMWRERRTSILVGITSVSSAMLEATHARGASVPSWISSNLMTQMRNPGKFHLQIQAAHIKGGL